MKYMLSWTVKPEDREESIKRWKAKGDSMPEGIKLISHYWNVNHLSGWAIFESSNHTKIAEWMLSWTDLNVNCVTPIIDDNELHQVVD